MSDSNFRQKRFANALLASVTVFSVPASATMRATTEQLFCASNLVIVASVMGGNGEDCRLHTSEKCEPQNSVRLSVVVSKVIAMSKALTAQLTENSSYAPSGMANIVGQTLTFSVDAISVDSPRTESFDPDAPSSGGDLVAPNNDPLTDSDVQRLYAGKEYVFTLITLDSPRNSANVWPMESRNWIMTTLRERGGEHCPAILP